MKLEMKLVSTSAATDYLDADKHVNLGKITTAGKKIEAAANKFKAAQAKGDAVAAKVIAKLGARTARQIEKVMAPISYYYVSKKTKPVPYSAAKQKAQDVTYLRKRAVRVMNRKRTSDAYTLVFAEYNPAILTKEAAALQRDLIKAVGSHGTTSEKTKEVASRVTMQRNDDESKAFDANMGALLGLLGEKIKPTAVFNYTPTRGKPASYLTLPNKGVLVVRYADAAQLRAIKKKAAEEEAKASTSSDMESLSLKVTHGAYVPPSTKKVDAEKEAELRKQRAVHRNKMRTDPKYAAKHNAKKAAAERQKAKQGKKAADVMKRIQQGHAKVKEAVAKLNERVHELRQKKATTKGKEAKAAVQKQINALRLQIRGLRAAHDSKVHAAMRKHSALRGATKYRFGRRHKKQSTSCDMDNSAIRMLAQFVQNSGCTVTYNPAEGNFTISRGDAPVTVVQGADADALGDQIESYLDNDDMDHQTAMFAAAKPWIENSV